MSSDVATLEPVPRAIDLTARLELIQFVLTVANREVEEQRVLAELCHRLIAVGVPVMRASLGHTTLHPTISGYSIEWWREEDITHLEQWMRIDTLDDSELMRSPFYYMYKTDLPRLRERLDGPGPARFPLVQGLKEKGATDYYAISTDSSEDAPVGPFAGFAASWTTDAPGGFTDDQIDLLEALLPAIGLAIKANAAVRVADGLLRTYLGSDAGRRVLSGTIDRGSVDTIRAVIWNTDLHGFTRAVDAMPKEEVIQLLNDYFEIMVDIVHDRGGHVLKFMGDGMLAIFELPDGPEDVCCAALDGAVTAVQKMEELNQRRQEEGRPAIDFRLSLHLGDVLYGNIGGRDRLDFTVIGPAVNETSRLDAIARTLEAKVIVSSAFAEASGCGRDRLVSLGRYKLRGVGEVQHLYTFS